MKILVTGGSGLVGNAIKKLVKNEDEYLFLSSKSCDLRIKNQVESIFKDFLPDVVIHLANKVAGLYGNMNNNYLFLVENIEMNINVLEMCRKYKVKKLINILSTCVFPDKGVNYPLTSDQICNGEPHSSNYGYSYSKRILYNGGKLLSLSNDIKVVNLIPVNLYGENDNYNLEMSHVIPGLIHKCYLSQKENKDLVIKGSGKALRQFLYAEDFANIIMHFVKTNFNEKYIESIVSPSVEFEISIKTLVNKIVEIFQFKGNVIYDTSYSDGQYSKTADSSELQKYIHYNFTNLDEGLTKTIQYFIENYEKLRV